MCRASAYAKINLSLEVLGKRPDGYHELVSLMQKVSFSDELRVRRAEKFELSSSDPQLVPERNLVAKAAQLLFDRYPGYGNCCIELEKRIPMAAGLGGGSSDAATTLLLLADLYGLNLPCEALLELACQLGSDVPFFLYKGTALVEGRGELVTPLPEPPRVWYVLARPSIPVQTRSIFESLSPSEWSSGRRTRELANDLAVGGKIQVGINSLEGALFRLHPDARACFEATAALTHAGSGLSGSGPTMFGIVSSPEEAEEASATLREQGYWSQAACSCTIDGEHSPCV